MNVMDILIMAMFVAIAGAGFFYGVVRMGSTMIAVYLAMIISATFYQRLGDLIQAGMGSIGVGAAYFMAFVFLFVATTLVFAFAIITTIRPTAQKRRFAILDNLGGATVSVAIACIAITMSLAITVIMVQAAVVASGSSSSGGMAAIGRQMDASTLAPLFLRFLPILTTFVRPWFPGGLPPILTDAGDL